MKWNKTTEQLPPLDGRDVLLTHGRKLNDEFIYKVGYLIHDRDYKFQVNGKDSVALSPYHFEYWAEIPEVIRED